MDDLTRLIVTTLASVLHRDPGELRLDREIFELGATSRELLLVLFKIEQELGICLPDDRLSTLSTIGDVVEAVRSAQVSGEPA